MVTYCVTKIIPTCSPVLGNFLIPRLQHQLIKSGYNDTSKSKSWKVLETILSPLKAALHIGWQLRKKKYSRIGWSSEVTGRRILIRKYTFSQRRQFAAVMPSQNCIQFSIVFQSRLVSINTNKNCKMIHSHLIDISIFLTAKDIHVNG